ncbi:MAG TPA: PAS domain S-box protein [Labilithrix sp.]
MSDELTGGRGRLLEDAAFRLLASSVVDYAIYMLDVQGHVASWNAGAERIKGYAAAEIVGQHFSRFFTDEDRRAGKPDEHLAIAARDGRIEDEGWRVRKDGSRFWASTVVTAMRDESGALIGFAKVTRDLTERRRAEEERLEMGRRAARALQTLSDLSIALANARTTSDVAGVVVDRGVALAGADTCFLYLLDERGETLELIGHRGVVPEVVERSRRLTAQTAPESFEAMRSGESVWAETADEYARRFPKIAAIRATGKRARAFWSAPLVVEGRPIGLFGMGFYEERRFPAEERSLADTLTKQCAQALARADRLAREERLRSWIATTLRSIGDAVIATDPDGRVNFMNSVAEDLTAWSETDARGRSLDEVFCIFSEETRATVESPVIKVLREGKVVGLANHTVLRSKSGREIPIADSAAPIRDADGNLFGVVLVFRDATEAKRESTRRAFLASAGAALASSLDYKKTLAAVAQLAVPELADWCAVDLLEPGARAPEHVAVAHVDPAKVEWARKLGEKYPPDPNAPTGVPNVIRTGRPELYAELPASLLEASARDAEHLAMIKQLKLESAMLVPLLGRERTIGAITFIYADSGRRYSEDDLVFAAEFARRAAMAIENAWTMKESEEARAEERRLRREADIANRTKDEFLATVSHELRTPLNAIVGWTVTLRERNPPPEIDRALAIVERNARRQARLIEDVLDMSRIISGKMSLTAVVTKVGEIVDGAIEAVSPAAQAKQISLEVDVDRALTITADSDRLQQVVWNILANAVKFSSKGGVVSVRAFREGSEVSIAVLDHGEGIAPDVQPFVFEPFRQADATTTRRHGGLGLGLAIVKQLVTAHGGTVAVTSAGVGHGAEFVVRLPARAIIPAVVDAGDAPVSTALASSSEAAPRLDGLNVLVVDDEEDARVIVEQVLTDKGANVKTAASAREALELFASSPPDVIVCDIGMPGMDGYALLRTVRALPPTRGGRTPALALTAYARKEDAQRALAAGFQMHAPKPIEPAHLATLVANLGGRTL